MNKESTEKKAAVALDVVWQLPPVRKKKKKVLAALVSSLLKRNPWRKGGSLGRNLSPKDIKKLNKGKRIPYPSKAVTRGPGWLDRYTGGYWRPAVRNTYTGAILGGGGGAYLGGGFLADSTHPGDTPLPPASLDEPTTHQYPPTGTESVLVGGAVGGLGSLLYGTLRERPDLRRDLIAMLLGGAAGGAYSLWKNPSKEVEASSLDKSAASLPPEALGPLRWGGRGAPGLGRGALGLVGRRALGLVGGPMVWGAMGAHLVGDLSIQGYEKYQIQKERRRINDLELDLQKYYADRQMANDAKAIEAVKERSTAVNNLTTSQKAQRLGAGGALVGGALGGLLSSAFGQVTDRESLRRDLIAMLAGGVIGGTAGVLRADPSLTPDWARSAADSVQSAADKIRSSVSDRLSTKV